MDYFIYIADDFFFLCIGLLLLYLFILAVASHFKHSNYPKARKQYQCAILVQDGSLLPFMYQQEAYEFITYKDLLEAINSLDKERYELVILLSDKASALSPHFLEKIYNAYDAGIQAMQLHTIINNRKTRKNASTFLIFFNFFCSFVFFPSLKGFSAILMHNLSQN